MHIAEIDESIDPISRDDAVQVADPRQMTRAQLRRLGRAAAGVPAVRHG